MIAPATVLRDFGSFIEGSIRSARSAVSRGGGAGCKHSAGGPDETMRPARLRDASGQLDLWPRNPRRRYADAELLGGRRLALHIDHLDAAVHLGERLARILELALAVAHRHQIGAGNAELLDQIALDRIGAAL